ncbi:MAG: P1 family peptidase [Parvularculaceae bacterium]
MDRRTLLGALASATTTGLVLPQLAAAATSGGSEAAPPAGPVAGPGPRNLITDVRGLKVGLAQDPKVATGATIILPDTPAVAACDVRGGGPATRETDALTPENLVQVVDAIMLSGGSVYGMAAADGVIAAMGASGRGFSMGARPGVPPSPIVPTACLYDLANGGDKSWGENPPYRKLGLKAFRAAGETFELGAKGAGYGAMSGGLKGGLGSASIVSADGFTVGAIVAVNSLGSAIAPGGKQFWAAPFEINGEFGGLGTAELKGAPEAYRPDLPPPAPRQNTTIACIATDVALTRVELKRVVIMAQDALARALRPVHAPFDGDVVFGLSTGVIEAPDTAPRSVLSMRLGALAADTLARAIARAVYEATAIPVSDNPAWRDL